MSCVVIQSVPQVQLIGELLFGKTQENMEMEMLEIMLF
jgi:hypothetical protein